MSFLPPMQLIVGPTSHGVTEYASDFAEAVRLRHPDVVMVRVADAASAADAVRRFGRAHLHVTDALFGAGIEEASVNVDRIARAGRVSMTLHDVPQASDGERNLRRRGVGYARMIAGAAGVVVSSRHELALLGSHVETGARADVIPLGTRVKTAPVRSSPVSQDETVLVAGYVYPGKGHEDVLRAAALIGERTGRAPRVEGLGGIARGHEGLADQLAGLAADLGVAFSLTGFLDADSYRSRCASAAVPVVAHRHFSASRSLLDWAEQGRRPIVVPSRYTLEMAALRPGTLTLTGPGLVDLADSIQGGLQDPSTTVLAPEHPIGPTLDDAAAQALDWWESLEW